MRGYGAKETIDRRAGRAPGRGTTSAPGRRPMSSSTSWTPTPPASPRFASLVRPRWYSRCRQTTSPMNAALRGEWGDRHQLRLTDVERATGTAGRGGSLTARIVTPPITRISLEEAPAALNPTQARSARRKTVIASCSRRNRLFPPEGSSGCIDMSIRVRVPNGSHWISTHGAARPQC